MYYKTSEIAVVDSYPYGRLRCKATFSVEFVKNKGFRSVFQTVNPKTQRVNAPKKSTYSTVVLMYKDANGHIHNHHIDFNGTEEINKGCRFMYEHFNLFTPEQIAYIYSQVLLHLKVSAQAICTYRGAKWEDIKPLFDSPLKLAVKGFKEASTPNAEHFNYFSDIKLDIAALNACEVKDYQPFRVTETYTIGANGITKN